MKRKHYKKHKDLLKASVQSGLQRTGLKNQKKRQIQDKNNVLYSQWLRKNDFLMWAEYKLKGMI